MAPLKLLEIPREFEPGDEPCSNMGTHFQHVNIPTTADQVWCLSVAEKEDMYKENLTMDNSGDHVPGEHRGAEAQEPFSWWQLPVPRLRDLLRGRRVKLVIDGIASGGSLLEASLWEGIAYIGVCMSETHKVNLEERSIKKVRGADGNSKDIVDKCALHCCSCQCKSSESKSADVAIANCWHCRSSKNCWHCRSSEHKSTGAKEEEERPPNRKS